MAHTTKDKKKLLSRVSRIRGQIAAVETALEEDKDCSSILQTIASCRGAINGLMAEILEGHIRLHVGSRDVDAAEREQAAEEVIDLVRAYLK